MAVSEQDGLFTGLLRKFIAHESYQEAWTEALEYNAYWTLLSGFLMLSQRPENDRAYLKECVDRAVKIAKNH